MKKLFNSLGLLFLANVVFAQTKTNTYKVNFSGADKRIVIMSANMSLEIVGTTGNEVIIEALEDRRELPEEAEGLKIVTPGGGTDNTGVGANVVIEGIGMKIKIPKSKYYGNYIIKIPKEISISVRENGNSYGKWQISGMKGEVEAQTTYSTLTMNNVSGPIVARGGYGKLYIIYDQLNQSKPNSISASGAVDITLPADTKANLNIKATYADLFTDFDIQQPKKVDSLNKNDKNTKTINYEGKTYYVQGNTTFDKGGKVVVLDGDANRDYPNRLYTIDSQKNIGYTSPDDFIKQKTWSSARASSDDCNCTSDNATIGTINGGGVELRIKSDHGNIYLRKKK